VKKFGKNWEVADFKDLGQTEKFDFWGIFRLFSAKNALFLLLFVKVGF